MTHCEKSFTLRRFSVCLTLKYEIRNSVQRLEVRKNMWSTYLVLSHTPSKKAWTDWIFKKGQNHWGTLLPIHIWETYPLCDTHLSPGLDREDAWFVGHLYKFDFCRHRKNRLFSEKLCYIWITHFFSVYSLGYGVGSSYPCKSTQG
jgi:hypothetical protein